VAEFSPAREKKKTEESLKNGASVATSKHPATANRFPPIGLEIRKRLIGACTILPFGTFIQSLPVGTAITSCVKSKVVCSFPPPADEVAPWLPAPLAWFSCSFV
jgi:hypothetical protein